MNITFLGGAGTVTGSKYLIEIRGYRLLIDCGLYQGKKELRKRNWADLPISPKDIDAVLLTHAHIDHSGYLPRFVKNGFTGPIYATSATKDLCRILLPDSGHIHEEDANRANRHGYTKHTPALPLYTVDDAKAALKQFETVQFGKAYGLHDDVIATWSRAGHILGSSFIQLQIDGLHIVFTGDMGRPYDPILKPPAQLQKADYLIIESTYGDREHSELDIGETLTDIINNTVKRKGTLLIPAFAVGRVQTTLFHLYQLQHEHKIPNLPIYLDSPMAISATKLMSKHLSEHKLSMAECVKIFDSVIYANTPDESRAIVANNDSKIIISASGMATGGRILHHLKIYAPDPDSTILFTGYQAQETRGDRIIRGEKEIKIHGEMIPVKAKVEVLTNTSAHADYTELLSWCEHIQSPPRKTFVTHGDRDSSNALKHHIEDKFSWECLVPNFLDTFELT